MLDDEWGGEGRFYIRMRRRSHYGVWMGSWRVGDEVCDQEGDFALGLMFYMGLSSPIEGISTAAWG